MDYRVEEAHLSDRERTVLLLASDGLTDKEIAQSLGLSLKTIHTYWDRMRLKLGASTRTQIFAKFLRLNGHGPAEERGLRQLFASSEEGVWILNSEGRTIYANPVVAHMFGYSVSDFDQRPAQDILEAAGTRDLLDRIMELQTEAQSVDAALQFKDGRKHWLRLKASPVNDEQGERRALALLVRDVSVEKRVQHALSSCEATLAALTDLSSDCIAKFDAELHCKYVNPAFVTLLDVPEPLIVGQHVGQLRDIFSPNRVWMDALGKAISTGERQEFVVPSSGLRPDSHTWLLPEPSLEPTPHSVITITRCA